MDIQVLNEITNPVRQAALSKLGTPVSANAQLKALRGNPVPAPGNPAPPPLEDSPEQVPDPVTPEISPVARAASAYSAAVGDGLNPDELGAIQDLSGRVRTAVSDFLSQPGLEQAENAAVVVASNPEAVQDLTSSVEQAVVETLSLPVPEVQVNVDAAPPSANPVAEIPASEDSISLERITNGATSNNRTPVVAASPALANSRASENTIVENPVTVVEAPESSRGDFTVTAASPALQNAIPQSAVVENPVNTTNAPASPSGDFRVTASSPVLQNAPAPADENVPVQTDAAPQSQPVSRPETVVANPQETPVTAASPALQNTQAGENARVETPVSRPETVVANPQETPVTAASPALQNTQAGENARVETPVSRPDTIPPNNPEAPVTAASPALQNPQPQNARVETPVSRPDTIPPNNPEAPVTAASPALQNPQPQNAPVGNPVNNPAPSVDQGQGLEGPQVQTVNPEGAIAPPEGTSGQTASGQSNPQPASGPQPVPAQSNELFAQENATVNPENIRNVNALVHSVVDNELTSEAKKIFSEPKVIRTVADLADFILERLREIITAKQQQSSSNGEIGLS